MSERHRSDDDHKDAQKPQARAQPSVAPPPKVGSTGRLVLPGGRAISTRGIPVVQPDGTRPASPAVRTGLTVRASAVDLTEHTAPATASAMPPRPAEQRPTNSPGQTPPVAHPTEHRVTPSTGTNRVELVAPAAPVNEKTPKRPIPISRMPRPEQRHKPAVHDTAKELAPVEDTELDERPTLQGDKQVPMAAALGGPVEKPSTIAIHAFIDDFTSELEAEAQRRAAQEAQAEAARERERLRALHSQSVLEDEDDEASAELGSVGNWVRRWGVLSMTGFTGLALIVWSLISPNDTDVSSAMNMATPSVSTPSANQAHASAERNIARAEAVETQSPGSSLALPNQPAGAIDPAGDAAGPPLAAGTESESDAAEAIPAGSAEQIRAPAGRANDRSTERYAASRSSRSSRSSERHPSTSTKPAPSAAPTNKKASPQRKSSEKAPTPAAQEKSAASKPAPAKPKNAQQLLADAKTAYDQGQAKQAYALAAKSYQMDGSPNALMLMGQSACKMRDKNRAVAVYSRLGLFKRPKLAATCRTEGVELR